MKEFTVSDTQVTSASQETQKFPPIQLRAGVRYYTREGRIVKIDRAMTGEERALFTSPDQYNWRASNGQLFTDEGRWCWELDTEHDLVAEYNSPESLPLIELRIQRLKDELAEAEAERNRLATFLNDVAIIGQIIRNAQEQAAAYPWVTSEAPNV